MKIPPLNPLKVFEVVARTGNLTAAGKELHVSQSAVSRQIAVLEEYLGVKLFTRDRIGVELTNIGKTYANRVAPAFAQISDATDLITRKYSDNAIRLRAYTGLTARWLIPRLPQFNALYPNIDVRIINTTTPLNFDSDQCDIAIVFGDGNWPGAHASLLLEDIIEPVCAPGFMERPIDGHGTEDALRGKRLLVSKYRKDDWPNWLAHVGVGDFFARADTMVLGSSILVWQAAVDGLGIAMGQQHMLEADFQAGRLVRPFARPLHTGKGHYLVWPALQRHSDKIAVFTDWLKTQAKK